MITTEETTRYQYETGALPLSAAHARELRLLLTSAVDAGGDREARIYNSMLRRLDAKASAIHGIVEVSMLHLRPADRCFLDDAARPRAIHGTAAMKGVFGWLIYAHHERTCSGVSDALWTIMVWARDLGCDYVLFDLDAPLHPDLPVFDANTGERVT